MQAGDRGREAHADAVRERHVAGVVSQPGERDRPGQRDDTAAERRPGGAAAVFIHDRAS
jgi:hypothetical protein